MTCTNCSHNNEQGAEFCAGCGATLKQYQQTAEAPDSGAEANEIVFVKRLRLKKAIVLVIAAAVVIIAAVNIIPALGGLRYDAIKDWIEILEDDFEVIISGNNNPRFKIDGELDSYEISIDRSKAVVLVDFDDEDSFGGALWFVTTSDAHLIAEDVFGYLLADSGNGVAYLSDYDEDNNTAALYLYETAGRRKTLITGDASCMDYGSLFGFAISPDGKSVGYAADYDKNSGEFTGYIVTDGNRQRLGDNMLAMVISNGGKYLYYIEIDQEDYIASLYVRSGQNVSRLAVDADKISGAFILNKDYSQAIFTISDGDARSYISRNGAERERISGPAIRSLVLPRDTQSRSIYNMARINIYGVSSFSGFVARTSESISYYNSELEPDRASSSDRNAYSASVSSDGKTLYYLNNSNRLSFIKFKGAGAERTDIDKDVVSFVASADGKSVYYVNDENELYFAKQGGTPVKIADDVFARSLALSFSSNRVYFLVDYSDSKGGELYYSDNGGRKAKVQGAFEVIGVVSSPTNIFFVTVDGEYYRSNGNENFTRFYEVDETGSKGEQNP